MKTLMILAAAALIGVTAIPAQARFNDRDAKHGCNAGQLDNISMATRNATKYFNVLPPGSNGAVLFVGSRQGKQFGRVLDRSGDWTVRLSQMGQAPDSGETHAYRLEIVVAADRGTMAPDIAGLIEPRRPRRGKKY